MYRSGIPDWVARESEASPCLRATVIGWVGLERSADPSAGGTRQRRRKPESAASSGRDHDLARAGSEGNPYEPIAVVSTAASRVCLPAYSGHRYDPNTGC